MDLNNAFLLGELNEGIYMLPPVDFHDRNDSRICKHKSLYDLKQASRPWFSKNCNALLVLDFVQSKADYSLFTRIHGLCFITLFVYVDDVIVSFNDEASVSNVKYLLVSNLS